MLRPQVRLHLQDCRDEEVVDEEEAEAATSEEACSARAQACQMSAAKTEQGESSVAEVEEVEGAVEEDEGTGTERRVSLRQRPWTESGTRPTYTHPHSLAVEASLVIA